MHISAFVPTSSVLVEGGVVNASGVPQTLELGDAEAKHRSKPCALHAEPTNTEGLYSSPMPQSGDNVRRARIISQIARIGRPSEERRQRTA
jgi:hypothetical protein